VKRTFPLFQHEKFLRENGLSLTLIGITLITLAGNLLTGWHLFNEEPREYGQPARPFGA